MIKHIIKFYNEGHTMTETGRKFGYNPGSVRYYLVKNNIPIRKFDKSGENNPKWHGGIMYDKGRKLIYSPRHPHPDHNNKYCYEYKLKVERKIGRFLKRYGHRNPKNEVVHHIDGDYTNNKLNNLLVVTQKEHARIHTQGLEFKKTHRKFFNMYKNIKRDKGGRFTNESR